MKGSSSHPASDLDLRSLIKAFPFSNSQSSAYTNQQLGTMFANHLATIAPHAAVMVSPSHYNTKPRSSSIARASTSTNTTKHRAKSEDTTKKDGAEVRIPPRQSV
ncbi:hypothetical protein PF005_g20109 [Phytophthora fragariae]|uniref:Uncharacterized protein n=1 Tax=Phytophthora fragariae TaxID=53985 RepID=A0A6A3E980_9STRA|nr:hypothetical protein PF003_g10972 [Phytophthora fragariae]KAE8928826.1 hypothetical protein PF009_g21045 [Phytophthora fragariae]KAE8989511.1 hypothetical protein PF011_g18740 [Phytophthora fragariae]KAE9087651.1 hypothetical protein PF007_g20287 [Phytophthora fragariae]KAE9087902.1 hypothetical protein PF010_g19557 [Phytophthora fragariae]